jgi:hypothetical protein
MLLVNCAVCEMWNVKKVWAFFQNQFPESDNNQDIEDEDKCERTSKSKDEGVEGECSL